jgi:hypothetical protein
MNKQPPGDNYYFICPMTALPAADYAHAGGAADAPLNSDIGALLPIALCGRTSL